MQTAILLLLLVDLVVIGTPLRGSEAGQSQQNKASSKAKDNSTCDANPKWLAQSTMVDNHNWSVYDQRMQALHSCPNDVFKACGSNPPLFGPGFDAWLACANAFNRAGDICRNNADNIGKYQKDPSVCSPSASVPDGTSKSPDIGAQGISGIKNTSDVIQRAGPQIDAISALHLRAANPLSVPGMDDFSVSEHVASVRSSDIPGSGSPVPDGVRGYLAQDGTNSSATIDGFLSPDALEAADNTQRNPGDANARRNSLAATDSNASNVFSEYLSGLGDTTYRPLLQALEDPKSALSAAGQALAAPIDALNLVSSNLLQTLDAATFSGDAAAWGKLTGTFATTVASDGVARLTSQAFDGLSLTNTVANVVPSGETIALGFDDGTLDKFAASLNATTFKDFSNQDNWKGLMLTKILDPNVQKAFDITRVDVMEGVWRGVNGSGGPTDWELSKIYQNPQVWGSVKWFINGVAQPSGYNPFRR